MLVLPGLGLLIGRLVPAGPERAAEGRLLGLALLAAALLLTMPLLVFLANLAGLADKFNFLSDFARYGKRKQSACAMLARNKLTRPLKERDAGSAYPIRRPV